MKKIPASMKKKKTPAPLSAWFVIHLTRAEIDFIKNLLPPIAAAIINAEQIFRQQDKEKFAKKVASVKKTRKKTSSKL